jgi:hypothetical protein
MIRFEIAKVVQLLGGDEEFLRQALEVGLVPRAVEIFGEDEVSELLVARTLVRDLEVNWPGVEIILRMRREILATQRQASDLLELVTARLSPKES